MKSKKILKKFLSGLLILAAILTVMSIWPTSYYLETPGSANQVKPFITSKIGKPSPNYYMTTVSEEPASVLTFLWSYTQPFDERISQKDLLGTQDNAEYEQMQKYYMQTSQANAIYYAAKRAGKSPVRRYLGVYVMTILPNSDFKTKLKVGDTITKVDGIHFSSTQKLMAYIRSKKIDHRINVEVSRGGKSKKFSGKLTKLPGEKQAGIGIQLVDHTATKVTPKIKINAGNIGGPSAGLMFALTCYQMYIKDDLTKGRRVAGTGTIDESGHVGMIGGVDKKVVAASRQGMQIFFAPTERLPGVKKDETNYAVAKRTAERLQTKIKIVPVASFNDALHYLQHH